MQSDAFLSSLSEEQSIAARKTDVPVMVVAGAGSGKTRMLMGRFIHLVTPVSEGGCGVDPAEIMMMTFTNKVAREMRERLDPVLAELRERRDVKTTGAPWIGTFHSLSLRILREEVSRSGLGANFSIFDESDARSLATEVAETLDINGFDLDVFFRDLETAKARLLTPDVLARKAAEINIARMQSRDTPLQGNLPSWERVLSHFQTPRFTAAYAGYQRALTDQNAVDFSDLMSRVTLLMRSDADVRATWRQRFRHFMVDEVQDINRAQVAWLQAMAPGQGEDRAASVAFVGDDDQSIYGFRGSDVAVMRSLEKRYPGMDILFMPESYRCQPSILGLANTLIGNNAERYAKSLRPADPDRLSSPVTFRVSMTAEDEIAAISRDAANHIANGGEPSEFAVLTRTRDMSRQVARRLRAAGLPVTEGKASDIRRSAEVKDVMAYAGFLLNPEAETLMRRIANKPARGLGPTSMSKVIANARLKEVPVISEMRSIMNGRIEIPEEGKPYPKAFTSNMKAFGEIIVSMRNRISQAGNAAEALMGILEESGYLPDLRNQALRSLGDKASSLGGSPRSLSPREFISRLVSVEREGQEAEDGDLEAEIDQASGISESVRRIGNIAILLDQASSSESLAEFVQDASLEMSETATSGVQVMTIHASKGLEFDRVALPFWVQGVMPHSGAEMNGEEGLQEERRLAYVALTRARHALTVSMPKDIGMAKWIRIRGKGQTSPSPFLEEMISGNRELFRLDADEDRTPKFQKFWLSEMGGKASGRSPREEDATPGRSSPSASRGGGQGMDLLNRCSRRYSRGSSPDDNGRDVEVSP